MEVYVTGENTSFAPGDVVSGLEPSELVEIQRISPFGSKKLVEGIGCQTRRVIKRPLSNEELSNLVRVRGKDCTFNGDSAALLLGMEAKRIRIAYQFDPLFAVNSSIVDPLPHQEKELEGHIFRCHGFSEKILSIRFLSYRKELFQGVSLFQTYYPIF
jgi:hypothetical protein